MPHHIRPRGTQGITFDSVTVTGAAKGKGDYHTCDGVRSGVATGKTHPVPKCFEDRTDAALRGAAESSR